jgi:hypothetical protein
MSEDKPWIGARVYAFLFRFLGPAQIGPSTQEPTGAPDPEFSCPVCGHAMSEHSWTLDAGRRRMVCPTSPIPRD